MHRYVSKLNSYIMKANEHQTSIVNNGFAEAIKFRRVVVNRSISYHSQLLFIYRGSSSWQTREGPDPFKPLCHYVMLAFLLGGIIAVVGIGIWIGLRKGNLKDIPLGYVSVCCHGCVYRRESLGVCVCVSE